jgi:hypothetical protein
LHLARTHPPDGYPSNPGETGLLGTLFGEDDFLESRVRSMVIVSICSN